MILGPRAAAAPLGTLLQEIAPEILEVLADPSMGPRALFLMAFLRLPLPQLLSLFRGNASVLNQIAAPLRSAASEVVGEDNTPESRRKAAEDMARSVVEGLVYEHEDLKYEHEDLKSPHQLPQGEPQRFLSDVFENAIDLLIGPSAPPLPHFADQLHTCLRLGIGGFLVKLSGCFRSDGDATVQRIVSGSILQMLTEGEDLGQAASLVVPILTQVVESFARSLMVSYRNNNDNDDSTSNNNNSSPSYDNNTILRHQQH